MECGDDRGSSSHFPSALSADISICKFDAKPQHVLIIKRRNTPTVTTVAMRLAQFLSERYGITVIVEPAAAAEMAGHQPANIKTWLNQTSASNLAAMIDFVIAIGGDGTILWVSNLFPGFIPPVVGFSMGSLGYLNQFAIDEAENTLQQIVEDNFPVSFRQRIMVSIYDECHRKFNEMAGLNECVIDRGPSPFLTVLEVFYNNHFFTNVSADGLILATPSGSTAYSMSAGGPVVHPKVPCFLFTPISPHSLSFRPLVIPNTAKLRIEVSSDSRAPAWVAVDGRGGTEMKQGSYAIIELAPHPFPLVINHSTTKLDTWLSSLKRSLNWNQKIRQNASFENSPRVYPSQESAAHFSSANSLSNEKHHESDIQEQFFGTKNTTLHLPDNPSGSYNILYLDAESFKGKKASLIMNASVNVPFSTSQMHT
ncbi:naD(+)/naDH kinase domain-containing protein [Cardiosporidium cionae]|uniref:NaD(+)/naDH kinase domain-containing protein n=1 Tax=Cardiosporidium cionae TaxID=476202 RepID=A0ABQ7JCF4_9APIC|nr:naD(+)/naDH kinase domain-containing protein [Cardiosporidium cionae]|eukprot:KAF8821706.1 naD(+)/naDH kinase domain-containing protein [Cardiosporidium cionae]